MGRVALRGIEFLESRRLMSAGELDPTFGAGGVVDVAGGAMSAEVEVLPDGRVVTAEEQWTDFDESDVLIVRRFLQDGTPDASFGTGGASMLSGITGMPIDVTELALDSSGRILIAGRFGILRLSANGSLDTTFGGPARGHDDAQAGVALLPGTPNGLAIAPDGRIGIVGTGETFAFATVLTPSGAFDEDFDEGGSIHWGTNQRGIFDRTPTIEYIGTAAAFRATDGALIVGGAVTETLALQDIFRNEKEWVLRGFGPSGGGAEISPGSTDPLPEGVADLAAMPDGSFFMLAIGPENRALLAQRYDAAGAVAMSADVTLPLAGIDRFQGAEIAPLPDGRFYVLARETAAGDGVQLHIARYLADGSLDPTYVGPVALFPEGVEINQGDLAMGDGDDAFILTRQHLNGVNGDALSLRKLDGSGPRLTRNGTLLLGGTSGADEISVTRRFRDGRILAVVNDQARVFLPHLVKRIQIYAHGGDDAVTIGPDVRSAYLHGGDGDDTLTGGDGNDWLQGAVGNDSLTGGLGDDTLEGNAGNDYLLGSAGHDQLFGHGGRDTLLGTRGNDRLFGGPNSADVVSGGEGVDAAADDPLDAYAGVEQLLS